jgi:hypothetical protein
MWFYLLCLWMRSWCSLRHQAARPAFSFIAALWVWVVNALCLALLAIAVAPLPRDCVASDFKLATDWVARCDCGHGGCAVSDVRWL